MKWAEWISLNSSKTSDNEPEPEIPGANVPGIPGLGPPESRHGGFTQHDQLVGGLEHVIFFHILGMSSSQLTNIFQRGSNHQPYP